MLGRLEMSVDDCIKAYSELMKTVFKDKASFMPVTVSGKIKPRFDSSKLKKAIEDVLVQRKIGEKELLNNKAPRGCRVSVALPPSVLCIKSSPYPSSSNSKFSLKIMLAGCKHFGGHS